MVIREHAFEILFLKKKIKEYENDKEITKLNFYHFLNYICKNMIFFLSASITCIKVHKPMNFF